MYLSNGRPNCHGMKGTGIDRIPWYETLRKLVNWMLRWLGYLWPCIFKVKLYLRNRRLDCHGMKGTWVIRMPWCETQPLCDLRQRILLPTGWLKMSAFPSTRLVQENELKNGDCIRVIILSQWQFSPCEYGDLSVRLGSRIGPHHYRVVVEVHWRGAQGWRSISWLAATFNRVGGSFNLLMAATGDVWIIPSFRIWAYGLHVMRISCVITNCGQHQWAIPSLFSIVP